MSFGVEEDGLLVGLALVYDRVRDIGRPTFCFLGSGGDTYQQVLVADGRRDVTALLLDRLLSSGRDIELSSVPTEIAESYVGAAPSDIAFVDHNAPRFIEVSTDSFEPDPSSHLSSVGTVTDPAECVDLLTRPSETARWGAGTARSQQAAFFAATVDASVRAGRMTLFVDKIQDEAVDGLLVLHGSRSSVVWRNVGRPGCPPDHSLVQAAMAEAAERGSHRVLWPESCRTPGQPFALADVMRARRRGGVLAEVPLFARSIGRSLKSYGSS